MSDTEALADAADAVNRILRDGAREQGESRERLTRRLWVHPPICVLFDIDPAAGVVYVNDVHWVGGCGSCWRDGRLTVKWRDPFGVAHVRALDHRLALHHA